MQKKNRSKKPMSPNEALAGMGVIGTGLGIPVGLSYAHANHVQRAKKAQQLAAGKAAKRNALGNALRKHPLLGLSSAALLSGLGGYFIE